VQVAPTKNCLATINPELAVEWHPTKNGRLTASDVTSHSGKKVWWKCPVCGHEWEAEVYSRSNGSGCPGCAGRAPTSKNCLATINPELAVEWHPTKNGRLTASDVTPGSRQKVWWKCPVCGHEWDARVNGRSDGKGCPGCAGRAPTSKNCLATINPELAVEWHPTKNGRLTASDVTSHSGKKVWWKCPVCGHEWDATVADRSRGRGCPGCAGVVPTSKNCLATINPELAAEWHPTENGRLTASDVTPYSNKKVWWKCPVCGYEWDATVAGRSRGRNCPGCARRVLTSKNCLATVNPELAAEWHPCSMIDSPAVS
jgi:rubrerythrin